MVSPQRAWRALVTPPPHWVLELPHDGAHRRHLGGERAATVGRQQHQAAPLAHLQTVERPAVEEKFWDVIGLYLDPPDKALVLCYDEKSQCQALERTQPGLPLGIGHIRNKHLWLSAYSRKVCDFFGRLQRWTRADRARVL
jgi:hypothetical protein